jgi:uncharacterized membrane protein YkvA (DUF1232 family)
MPSKNLQKTIYSIGLIVIIAAVIWYIGWGVDLIPDSVPIVGRLDDLITLLVGIKVITKWKDAVFKSGSEA